MNNCANSLAFISHSAFEFHDFLGSITFGGIFLRFFGIDKLKYGIISVITQAYYNTSLLFQVSNNLFTPPPKVTVISISAVVPDAPVPVQV